MKAGAGVVTGVLAWGLLASLGLGAVLTVSEIGYRILQYAGAAYLVWLGARMLASALRKPVPGYGEAGRAEAHDHTEQASTLWFWRGLKTNLLNPKVGVFYVSFLPQFIPSDAPVVAVSLTLAGIHAVMGLAWFAALAAATKPFSCLFRHPMFIRGMDGATGSVLIAFGVRLALEERG